MENMLAHTYTVWGRAMAQPHVLLCPFPTQGHINPLLDFAHCLAHSGILSTLLLAPAHYDRYAGHHQHHHHHDDDDDDDDGDGEPEPEPRNNSLVRLLTFPLPPDAAHKLSAHDTNWLELFDITKAHFPAPLRDIVHQARAAPRTTTTPPISCLISDTFLPWMASLAADLGIPWVEMWASSATSFLYSSYMPLIISKGLLPFKQGTEDIMLDFIPGISNLRLGNIAVDFLTCNDLTLFPTDFHASGYPERVLINSFLGIEADAIAALRARNVNVVTIGPTFGVNYHKHNADETEHECLQWLDKQGAKSVVYVAFGSRGFLTGEEIREIANTLEAVGRPFLWAIHDGSAIESLPENFRSGSLPPKKGLIVPWAPQRQVLEHKAVGAFVSHCGWNSVIESLFNGVPIVGCPRMAEQNTNMWLLQKWGIGVASVDTMMGGIGCIQSATLSQALQCVMGTEDVSKEASEDSLRKKVSEMASEACAAVSPSGTSKKDFQGFVDWLHTKS